MPLPPDFPVSPHDILDPNTRWWFQEEHLPTGASGIAREFRYYFAQREAIETIIYLYEVLGTHRLSAVKTHNLSGLCQLLRRVVYEADRSVTGDTTDEI